MPLFTFGSGRKTYLHAAIDDATGTVVAAYFDKQETLNGYNNLFHADIDKLTAIPICFTPIAVPSLNIKR